MTQDEGVVTHRWIELDGMRVFVREAGVADAPAILLPHGYPCSSFAYRHLIPVLADRWRLVAPDFPGFGFSDTPEGFDYGFDGYAGFLERLTDHMGLRSYALYLHDYGSQIGLRLAMRRPERVAALIVQNGDIYEDQLGPKYAALQAHFARPTAETRAKLEAAVSEEGYREEFVGEIAPDLIPRLAPDLWTLHWALTTMPRKAIAVELMEGLRENLRWFPHYQEWLRTHRPPTLIIWGPQDGYMPEGAARAWLRDLPEAEFHLLDGGHWLLETHLAEVVRLMRGFLARVHA